MKNICNNWDKNEYKYINFTPDESLGEENRAWQGCPSVAVTRGGRLFAAWFTGGMFEPCINNYDVLVMSDDGGESWTSPILTVGSDRERLERNIDIQLWVTEEDYLWVMWTVSPYTVNSKPATIKTPFERDYQREFPRTDMMLCRDPDAETLVWERPRVLCEGFMRNKPIRTSSGRIIAPAYDYGAQMYKLRYSDDGGENFYNVEIEGKPDVNVYDEISVYEKSPGELRFLARTSRGYYVYSDSHDGGESWSRAEEYEPAPGTRCYMGKLRDGMTVYVRNVSNTQRTGITVMLSPDGGETFPYKMEIEDRERVSYPDVAEDERGNIYIIYDRERDNRVKLNRETWVSEAAKEILICKLTQDDVKSGKISDGSYLRRVICRGKKHTVEM